MGRGDRNSRYAAATLALLLGACGGTGGATPCPVTHRVEAGACVPIFDECPGPAELPVLGGGCRAVGVLQCAPGFVEDGAGGCDPVLPADPWSCPAGTMPALGQASCQPVGVAEPPDCPDGEIAIPGDLACRPVSDCGTGTWGAIVIEPGALHVDQAYAGGGSNGSASAPYTTVTDALLAAPPGGQVVIAAGDYAERLTLSRPVSLHGRCPELVTLRGVLFLGTPQPALTITGGGDGSEVRGVRLTGPAAGLWVDGVTGVRVEAVEVRDTAEHGIILTVAEASLVGVVVGRATQVGVLTRGSEADLDGCVIRSTQPDPNGRAGRGIDAGCDPGGQGCGRLTLRGSVVTENHELGILTIDLPAEIEGTVITDTQPQMFDQRFGVGIRARCVLGGQSCGSLVLRDSLVARNREAGVATSGMVAEVVGTIVADTEPRGGSGIFGRGVEAQCEPGGGDCGSITVRDSLITRNHDAGLSLSGVTAVVEGTVVSLTESPAGSQRTGRGINAQCGLGGQGCGSLTVRASLVGDNRDVAISSMGVPTVVEDSLVAETRGRASDQAFGRGINAQCDATGAACGSLTVIGSRIAANHDIGIFAAGVITEVEDTTVVDTKPQVSDQTYGDGLQVRCDLSGRGCGNLIVRGSFFARNHEVGVAISGVEAVVEGTLITDTQPRPAGAPVFPEQFGDGIFAICDAVTGDCGTLSVIGCAIRRSGSGGVATNWISGLLEGSLVDAVAPEPTAGAFGIGLQVANVGPGPGGPVVFDTRDTVIRGAALAGIYFFGAQGLVTNTAISGGSFSVALTGDAQPTVANDNDLRGDLQDGPIVVDFSPQPAPEPALPGGV